MFISKPLANRIKAQMLQARFGEVLGVHERDHVERLFGVNTENPVGLVPFEELRKSARNFFDVFPAWKKIREEWSDSQLMDGHKSPDAKFVDKWIENIFLTLRERLTSKTESEEADMQVNNMSEIMVNEKLAEGFFYAFSGVAYTLSPEMNPGYFFPIFPDPHAPKRSEKLKDLLFHWHNSNILSSNSQEAQELLKGKEEGSFCVRFSHHFLWALASVGLTRLLVEERLTSNLGPIVLCFINQAGLYHELLITTELMNLTTISRQLRSAQGFRKCINCGKCCLKDFPGPAAYASDMGSYIGDILEGEKLTDMDVHNLFNSNKRLKTEHINGNQQSTKSKKLFSVFYFSTEN